MSYLLTIELREGDHVLNEVGPVVAMEQAWAFTIEDALAEFAAIPLTGDRFKRMLETLAQGDKPGMVERIIAADPRKTVVA